MTKATIIGTTSWGRALASLLSKNGTTVNVWARTESEARELETANQRQQLHFTSHSELALHDSDLVIWAVPSHTLRQNVRRVKEHLPSDSLLVSAAKGLEVDSGKRMSEVLAEEAHPTSPEQICVLSGPNLSREIEMGLPAFTVAAASRLSVARRLQRHLSSHLFSVVASSDVIGVELGGALKNIIALGAGMVDGLELGNNAKAGFTALGWSEVISLSVRLGARRSTLYGLAGLGDLIATCSSNLSRNHHVGYELARGRSLPEITGSMHQVAEGVHACQAARKLTRRMGLETPIMDLIYDVLFDGLPAAEAFRRLGVLNGK